MRAAVYERYGGPDVITVRDVPEPLPRTGEIRIRVRAATVSSGDCRVRSLNMPGGFGLIAPLVFGIGGPRNRILGADLAGEVESIGAGVTKFKPGDRVIALTGMGFGGHAELRCLKEGGAVAKLPPEVPFDVGAAIPFGGTTALCYLRDKAKVRAGASVLVIGAAGAVGSAAVQLARHFGAKVTGVCSQGSSELVRSLGAAECIDYATHDALDGSTRYDVILDATGGVGIGRGLRALRDGGRLLLVAASVGQLLAAPLHLRGGKRVLGGPFTERAADLASLADLVRTGVFRPLISSRFPLDRIAEAHVIVDSRHKRGNVVIEM